MESAVTLFVVFGAIVLGLLAYALFHDEDDDFSLWVETEIELDARRKAASDSRLSKNRVDDGVED